MSAAPFCCRLVVMAKAPVAGRSKTRLARDIGVGRATGFARAAARAAILRVGRDRRWQTILAVAPDTSVAAPVWPRDIACIGQGMGDLGQRMQGLITRMPPGPVVLVGSDIPGMRASHIAQAFSLLRSHDAVFGPAGDGGFWLVGFTRRGALRAFAGVRWSSPHALADTLANLAGVRIAFAPMLHDVDTVEDLRCATRIAGRVVAC